MEHLLTSESIISLLVLIALEIVLGVDNVIFVSLIVNRLTPDQRKTARLFWLIEGITVRSIMLLGISWLLKQKGKALFTVPFIDKGMDLASLVMIAGGLFLMYKSFTELYSKLEGQSHSSQTKSQPLSLMAGLVQIFIIDAVFSFDSVITASGTTKHIEIMIIAVVVAMIVMFTFASRISSFIELHPSLQILALVFLVMIGLSLVIEGWAPEQAEQLHLKNYIYFAMAFALIIELLNMRFRKNTDKPVELKGPKDVDLG